MRFEVTDTLHSAGERIAASSAVIRIGQQNDCEIQLENRSEYADELFAIVRPCRNGEGWQLIPCSEFVQVSVNGVEVELVTYLSDGDRIRFGDERQELLFNIRHDEKYDTASGTVHIAPAISRNMIAALALISLVLFAVMGAVVHRTAHADKRLLAVLESAKPSVVQIVVDSVFYVETTPAGNRVLRRIALADDAGHAVRGTAFLTRDSLLVTARHCIEPWLNDAEIMTADDAALLKSTAARWALEAETYNQTSVSDTIYRVVSGCLVEQMDERFESSEFVFDTSRDDIMDMGDYYRDCYWRSIRGRHGNREAMLGDIASIKVGRAGNIALASDNQLTELLHEGSKICFMGYPDYETDGIEHSAGEVKRSFTHGEMIVHDGASLKHGYSGGPVFVFRNGQLVAAGVISVMDAMGGNRIYSVPVSECAHRKGGRQ